MIPASHKGARCLGFVILTLLTASAYADPVTSRAALQTRRDGRGTLETFEAYRFTSDEAIRLFCGALDANTVCNGQGPHLVDAGFRMSVDQWNPAGYYGAPSKEVSYSGDRMQIDFLEPVREFGIDLRAYASFPTSATIRLFALDDVTAIGSISDISLSGTGVPVFVGWRAASGIGRVELFQLAQPGNLKTYSPVVDNLEFGPSPVPEPSTLLLFGAGAGLVARRVARRRLSAP